MKKDIAKKNFMNLWVRLLMIIVVLVYIIIPKAESLFDIVTYLMIAYGVVTLILLIHQLLQPKVLISIEDDYLVLHLINKKIKLLKDEVESFSLKEQSNRGYVHTYGKIIFSLISKKKVTIYNVKDLDDVEKELTKFLDKKSI